MANKGYTENEAKAILNSNGFSSDRIQVVRASTNNQAQDGKVIFQDPAEGSPRNPSTVIITLTIGDFAEPSPTADPSESTGPP